VLPAADAPIPALPAESGVRRVAPPEHGSPRTSGLNGAHSHRKGQLALPNTLTTTRRSSACGSAGRFLRTREVRFQRSTAAPAGAPPPHPPPPPPASPWPSSRRANERPSGESSRIAVMGIIRATSSTTTKTHMEGFYEALAQRATSCSSASTEAGPVANEERREREHALLRLPRWIDGCTSAGDLAHQRLALEALEARDELLLDRLRARERRVACGLDGPLERRVDPHDGLEQVTVLLLEAAAQRRERRHGLRRQLVPDEARPRARPACHRTPRDRSRDAPSASPPGPPRSRPTSAAPEAGGSRERAVQRHGVLRYLSSAGPAV